MATENYDWLLARFPASQHDRVRAALPTIDRLSRAVTEGCAPEALGTLAKLAEAFGAVAAACRAEHALAATR